ncbi:MAG TPA: exosortase/archaeosortase family protein [Chthoniobacterales bacterium]
MPYRNKPLMLAALGVIPALAILYGFVPYTYSHLEIGSQLVSVFHAVWIMWNRFPDFQYGMLVPFILGFIIYRQRDELAALPVTGWAWGWVPVLLTLALFWAGRRVDNQYLGFFSFQILSAALVLWLLGWKWLRALAFPLGFLIFAWPMPFLDNMVTFPLRMLMATQSVAVLNLLGVPAIQEGSGILSAGNAQFQFAPGQLFQVDVADPCSGIHSLYALIMLSAIYAHFALRSSWKKGFLVLSAIPLAVFGNLVRIFLLTISIIMLGAPTAIGTLKDPSWIHEGAGYLVFVVAVGGMIGVASLLNSDPRTWRRKFHSIPDKVSEATQREVRNETSPSDIY